MAEAIIHPVTCTGLAVDVSIAHQRPVISPMATKYDVLWLVELLEILERGRLHLYTWKG